MAFAVLLLLLAAYSNAAPAINYMTSCERMLHTQCVINIGSSKEFRAECKQEKLVSCLRDSSEQTICTEHDKDTIPTIRRLVGMTVRKFKNDPDFCKSDAKFSDFIVKLQNTITVQGEGIEFTDPRSYEYSGSGDSIMPDDTESDDDDEKEDDENDTVVQKTDRKKEQKENTVRKDSKFWKEKSKLIVKGKNDRKVQMLVYFDDHDRNKNKNKNKKTLDSDAESARFQKAWDALKRRYQRWYESSKYYRVKK